MDSYERWKACAVTLVWLAVMTFYGGFFGWFTRDWIADKEHDRRWDEGCRHNIEERWHD